MDIFLQIAFGAYIGWMLDKPWTNKSLNILLGIMGAMSGSLIMNSFGLVGVYGYNFYSFFVALLWAAIAILTGRLLERFSFTKVYSDFVLKNSAPILQPI